MPESIGSVSVQVIADYSKMVAGFQTAQAEAQKAGSSIASSFSSGVAPAGNLEAAINRVTETIVRENAALSLSIQRNQALIGARSAAAGAASQHAAATAHEVSQLQATSGAIRTLEGSGGLRAVENFLSKTLGLGPAMQAIFPIVGGIAFLEILGSVVGKAGEYIAKMNESARATQQAALQMKNDFATTNDELEKSIHLLDNQISKLTGRPENVLKLMLDDAAISADKLATSLKNASDELIKFTSEHNISALQALVQAFTGGQARSTGNEEFIRQYKQTSDNVQQIITTTRDAIKGLGTTQEAVSQANELRTKAELLVESSYQKLIDERKTKLEALNSQQAKFNAFVPPKTAPGADTSAFGAAARPADQTQNIATTQAQLDTLISQKQRASLEFQKVDREQTIAGLKTAKDAQAELRKQFDSEFADQDSQFKLSIGQEIKFWDERLQIADSKGKQFADLQQEITNRLGNLRQAFINQQATDQKTQESNFLKAIEARAQSAMLAAEKSGQPQQAAKLGVLQQEQESARMRGQLGLVETLGQEIVKTQIRTDAEGTAALHKALADQEAAWKESENRTAADTIAFFELRKSLYSNDADVVRRANEQIAAAHRKQAEEQFRITDLQNKNTAAAGLADVESSKIKIQSQFDLKSVTTAQDRIKLAQDLAARDARGLEIKLAQADADVAAAKAKKDNVAITVAEIEQATVLRDILIQQEQTDARIAKMKQEESFRGRVSKGLSDDFNQAGQGLASSFSRELINGGKIGQVFRDALKNLEASALTTVLQNAFKSAVEASGLDKIFNKITGGSTQGPLVTATHQQTAATHQLTQSINNLNARLQGLQSSVQADTVATNADAAATESTVAGEIANTAALAANTVATWVNTAALIFNGIVNIMTGGMAGGSGGGGGGAEQVTSTFKPMAKGGAVSSSVPHIVGEEGPELFIPGTNGMIIPADKTKAMLAQLSMPSLNIGVPSTPSGMFGSNAGLSNIIGGASSVTNQNTGSIGSMHFAIYDTGNPRETARQIADIMKRQSPRFSPSNLGPQTA